MIKINTPIRRLLFTLLMIVACYSFLELGAFFIYRYRLDSAARTALERILEIDARNENIKLRYIPHPYFNYVNNPDFTFADGYRPHNRHGFRKPGWPSEKKPGTLRIIALGGSTTYGVLSRDGQDVWPAVVERLLNHEKPGSVEILNLGVNAYTTFETIGVLAMLVPTLSPDIVLIHCGVNDAFSAAYPDEGGPDNTCFRFQWNYRSLPRWKKFLMRHSYTFRLLGRRSIGSAANMPGDMINAMQFPLPDDKTAWKAGQKADGRYFARNLKTMIAITRSFGALPVLIDHPINPRWNRSPRLLFQVLINTTMLYNRLIQTAGNQENVPVISLYGAMRNPDLFVDAVHENDKGTEIKSALIAEGMKPLMEQLKLRQTEPKNR